MSELRQDPTSGRLVIVAPHRQLRPGMQHLERRAGVVTRPAFDPHCPFCAGNEASLPGIIAETRTDAPPHWAVRVVPNKFPILLPEAKARPADRHHVEAGFGIHEIIIESPRHDGDLAAATDLGIEAVTSSYRDRSRHLLAQSGIEAVIVFRNHGRQGGASLSHPHSQILAVGSVPPLLGMLADWGRHRFEQTGRCPTCEEIAIERDLGVRVIDDTQEFLVIVPFAAAHPCEMWIVPKRHQASFPAIDDAQASEFARLLRRTLGRLRRARDDPPYNFVIDSAARSHLDSPFVHWRLRIAPDLATSGGFELGAGTPVNPSRPEDDAALLRAAAIDEDSLP